MRLRNGHFSSQFAGLPIASTHMVPFQMRVLFKFVLRFILEAECVNYFASELLPVAVGYLTMSMKPLDMPTHTVARPREEGHEQSHWRP